jgi:hypothetical protein
MRKQVFFRLVILTLILFAGVQMHAQSPDAVLLSVPTTKVLAIGTLNSPLTGEQRKGIMSREVPDTVKLYLAGKIEQWYVRKDGKGVVFLLNVGSTDEAKTLLQQLPLGQAKMMSFELIPLGPLSPLGLLLQDK